MKFLIFFFSYSLLLNEIISLTIPVTQKINPSDLQMMDISKIVEKTLQEFDELQKLTIKNNEKPQFSLDNMRFLQKFKTKLTTAVCIKKEGYVKVREIDQKAKEVPAVLGILSKDRFTYFLDPVIIKS